MATDNKDLRRDLDLSSVCDGNTIKLLTSHLQAVGVPGEYIFFPLISTVSSFLGQSTVKINDEWVELCALWTAVVALKGSKRSTILDRFMAAISDAKEPDQLGKSPLAQSGVHLGINVMCDEAMTPDVFTGDQRYLGLYEDLATSHLMEEDILRKAKRSYDTKPRTKQQTTLGLFSFLPPEEALALLDDKNVDMSSRFLIACPKRSLFKSADFKSPMPSNTPSLTKIFEVINMVHAQPMTYTFSQQAKAAFDVYYDVLQDGLLRFDKDERNYCILAKAAGQLARMSACLAALKQAIKVVVYRENCSPANWDVEIAVDDIEAGKVIMDYAIDIRFTLLSRVSAFKGHQMCPPNSNQPRNLNPSFVPSNPRENDEPPAKRARVAAADAGVSSVVASSMPASEVSSGNQVAITVRQNPAVMEHKSPQMSNFNQSPANQLPGFSSTFATSGSTRSSQMSYGVGYDSPTPGQGDFIPTQGYFSNCPVANEDYYLPSRRNSSYVDFTSLSETELVAYSIEQQKFIRRFGYKIKKLLEYRPEYRISPSCCAQRHLMPPIPKNEMNKYDTQTRYPVLAAKEYLNKVAELGFGTIEGTWHATNNRRSILFNKHPYNQLNGDAKQLMVILNISAADYMAAFVAPQEEDLDYGGNPAQMDGQISSSSKFPVPYLSLQEQQSTPGDDTSILTIFPENPGDNGDSSSPPNRLQGSFVKSEPMDNN